MDPYPNIRELASPLTDGQLQPPGPELEYVQFQPPLGEDEYPRLAEFLKQYPKVTLLVYGHTLEPPDLAFLRHFPRLKRLHVELEALEGFEALELLPKGLEHLGLGRTRKKGLSLAVLRRFRHLRSLHLEGHARDLEVIAAMTDLRELSLRGITLPDLGLLTKLQWLRLLGIERGGTRDLGLLPDLPRLRALELSLVRGLSDLGPIAGASALQFLFLKSLKQVTALPDLSRLPLLRRVHLEAMKGLEDLAPLRAAPALRELCLFDMRHLRPEALAPLVGHPTLARLSVGLGSLKRTKTAEEMFGGLPPAGHRHIWATTDE